MSESEKSDNRYTYYRYVFIPVVICLILWSSRDIAMGLIRSLDEIRSVLWVLHVDAERQHCDLDGIRQEMQRQKP